MSKTIESLSELAKKAQEKVVVAVLAVEIL